MITEFRIFEEAKIEGIYYFIPYIDESLVALAIEKINTSKKIKDLIFRDSASFWENINSDNAQNYGVGCFITIKNSDIQPFTYWVCSLANTKEKAFLHFERDREVNWVYGGEIRLEDWEISANKYNL